MNNTCTWDFFSFSMFLDITSLWAFHQTVSSLMKCSSNLENRFEFLEVLKYILETCTWVSTKVIK